MNDKFQLFDGLENVDFPSRPLHLAIGMFDGVHLGHRAVIDAAVQSARRSGGLAAVLTFWPHPSSVMRPDRATKLIISPETKAHLLAAAGVDAVISQRFTPEFAQIEAEFFLPHLKKFLPRLDTIYVGENWRFGRGRRGDLALLLAEARKYGLTVFSSSRVQENGEPISSTRVRGCLEEGRIEEANSLLGYTYFAEGRVQAGKNLGQKLGFPTLNLPWEPELRPQFGVYAVRVTGPKSPRSHAGVANYGLRPTVEQSGQPRLEVHLFGLCPFDHGDEIKVEWLRFLRSEKKFGSIDALKAQIAEDTASAKKFFSGED
ncbi:MAG: riboflavin biosynthesis protein RibF [Nibricoccus sp.]